MDNLIIVFNKEKPIYYQIYIEIVNSIKDGRIKGTEKLPSKRALKNQLAVSVNTIDTAYQMLVAEGYVEARAKSGFYVRRLAVLRAPIQQGTAPKTKPVTEYECDFATQSVDTSLFPFKVWARIQREIFYTQPQLLNHGHRQGDENFRAAVAKYLHEYRGVQCTQEQIVIGAGIEYMLTLLGGLFRGERVAIEQPGFTKAERLLNAGGAATVFVSLDTSGLSTSKLQKSGADIAYITPSHQFPSGIAMPIKRRIELLEWASEKNNRYIIEDDYDSEFRFDSKPIPAMQGLCADDKVIYIGTFSKSVAPSMRIAYMVLPHRLLERYNAELYFFSSTVSRFEQQTLCRFLEDGHFARHLNRLRNAYRLRRDALVKELKSSFGDKISISGAHTGLHLLVEFNTNKSEQELVQAAARLGVRVQGLASYYVKAPFNLPPTLVLGYSAIGLNELKQAVQLLAKACIG